MKDSIKYLFILFAISFIASCTSRKATIQTETVQDSVSNEFISGKVNEIKPGKDGYTAQITTAGNLVYFATISRANLKNAEQYKSVNVGEIITVKGDIWKMENENHITVREMK